jgi:hypothetical protein
MLDASHPNTMMQTRFSHLPRTYAILFFAKDFWNYKRRSYSLVPDQPDVAHISMHTSIATKEARRINNPISGKNPT